MGRRRRARAQTANHTHPLFSLRGKPGLAARPAPRLEMPTAHDCLLQLNAYCTWTMVPEVMTGSACCLLSRAVALVTLTMLSPADFAWNVRTQSCPDPFTPATPGGREAEMATPPAPSSRWTSATVWPSWPR